MVVGWSASEEAVGSLQVLVLGSSCVSIMCSYCIFVSALSCGIILLSSELNAVGLILNIFCFQLVQWIKVKNMRTTK